MGETHEIKPAVKPEGGGTALKPKSVNFDKSVKREKDEKATKTDGKKRSRKKKSNGQSGETSTKTKKSNFKGGETKMNGHVFELHDESPNPGQFTRSKQEAERFFQADYEYGHDIVVLLQTREECDIDADMPEDLEDKMVPDLDANGDEQPDPNDSTKIKMKVKKPTAVEKELWKEDVKHFSERRHCYTKNKKSGFSLLLGQCSPRLLAHLKSLQEFKKRYLRSDLIWLLDEIQRAMSKFERTRYPHCALIDLYMKLFRFFQGDGMSDTNFDLRYDEFQTLLEHYGSNLGTDPVLIKYEMTEAGKTEEEIEQLMQNTEGSVYLKYRKLAQDRFFAALYLKCSNKTDYGPLLIKLENDFAQGSKRFPANVTGARNIKLTFRKEYASGKLQKKQTQAEVDDKENTPPEISLTQVPISEPTSRSFDENEIPTEPKSLFDCTFTTVSDSLDLNMHVALTQFGQVTLSDDSDDSDDDSSVLPKLVRDDSDDSDDDSSVMPDLVDRVIVETSGDESDMRGDMTSDSDSDDYTSSSDDSGPPGLVQRDNGETSEEEIDDDSNDESTTQYPRLIPKTPRRRFFDSSSDESGISADDDDDDSITPYGSHVHYFDGPRDLEVELPPKHVIVSDSPMDCSSDDDDDSVPLPGLIKPEDQSSSSESSCSDDSHDDFSSDDEESLSDDDSTASLSACTTIDIEVETPSEPSPSLTLNNSNSRKVPESWILLDTESSVSIFCTREFLTDIYTVGESDKLRLHGTGGYIDVYERGTLKDFGEVWFSPHSVANILSFAEMAQRFDVSYHQHENSFHVTNVDGRTLRFACRPPNRLYYFDASALLAGFRASSRVSRTLPSPSINPSEVKLTQFPASSTPIGLSASDAALVERVDPIYRAFNCPAPKSFLYMLQHEKIANIPISVEDFQHYLRLLNGAHPDALAGHATRKKPKAVRPMLCPLPETLQTKLKEVILCGDLCFIPNNIFLCTVSDKIDFFTSQSVANKRLDTIYAQLETVIHLYRLRGLEPVWFVTDMEFQGLEDRLIALGVRLNITAANEHVGKIERGIRTTKEDVRTILNSMPFHKYPTVVLREAFLYAVFMRNLMVRPGKLDGMSPASVVLGTATDYLSNCSLPCGTLCYIKSDPKPYNSVTKPRMVPAISCKPVGNVQGGYTFIQLHNWEKVTRYQWKVGAYTPEIIAQIEAKAQLDAEKQSQTEREDAESFTIRRMDQSVITSFEDDDISLLECDIFGQPIPIQSSAALDNEEQEITDEDREAQEQEPDAEQEEDANATDDEEEEDDQDDDDDDDDDDDNNDLDDPDNPSRNNDDDEDPPAEPEQGDENTQTHDTQSETGAQSEAGARETEPDDTPESTENQEREVEIETTDGGVEVTAQRDRTAKDTIPSHEVTPENIMPTEPDASRPGLASYNLRRSVNPTYKTTHVQVDEDDLLKLHYVPPVPCMRNSSNLWEIACTQMSAAEGVKRYGERAEEALVKEWLQLDDMKVYEGRHWWQMTKDQRRRAMRLVQLIKEKRCGKIKGRTCVDGRPQRDYIPKEDATSPTVTLESLMLSLMQDAYEDRCVGVVDIPGAFLHTPSDEDDHVVVDGVLVDMLVKSNAECAKYVHTTRSGKKIVYLKLKKHMYGTLKAARKFFEALTKLLLELGFEPNPYDHCVMNKLIDGSQCTVLWHVDDMKISHVLKQVVIDILQHLANKYGELKPTIGDSHSYVGMEIHFPGDRTVHINMQSYIETALEEFPDELGKSVTSPASEHLFTVDPNGTLISEDKRIIFHTIVARLLYIATRARPDIYPTISFLTSRCAKADIHDWKKLKRLLTYLRDTKDLDMILRADTMNVIKWWVDAAYGVRHDFRSQTGAAMSLGTGIFQAKSVKQGLNTKSSTEAEVVAASDMAPYLLWTRYFLEAQGITVDKCILYQDNESAMLLERNGTFSSGKRTKHINIRFFWLKDRVASNEIEIIHCGTDKMIADFFTKPLQGAKFIFFRDQILGHVIIIPDSSDPNQERVGDIANTAEQSYDNDSGVHDDVAPN